MGIPQPRGLTATSGHRATKRPVFMEFRDDRTVLRVGFQQSTAKKFSCITKGTFLTNEMKWVMATYSELFRLLQS